MTEIATVALLKARIAELEAEVARLKADNAALDRDADELADTVALLEGELEAVSP